MPAMSADHTFDRNRYIDDPGTGGCPDGYTPDGDGCVQAADDGSGIKLSSNRFLVDFNGKMQISISGQIVNPKSKNLYGIKRC
jgi:hypothetical protein